MRQPLGSTFFNILFPFTKRSGWKNAQMILDLRFINDVSMILLFYSGTNLMLPFSQIISIPSIGILISQWKPKKIASFLS